MSDKVEDVSEEVMNENLDNGSVLQKYKMAGQVANETLAILLKETKVDASIAALCELGDKTILEKVKTLFKKVKKMEKGIAFPTCVNVNETICHNSPSSDDVSKLKLGDIVRFDLAVHLDGFVATLAHTVVLTDKVIDGKSGDCFAAAQSCLDAAHKLIFEGNTNSNVTEAFGKIAESYGVTLMEGVLGHQLKRFVIDGSHSIQLKSTPDQTVEEFKFTNFEAYSVDVVITTGIGKLRETAPRTTIYKRLPEVDYHLKLKSSREALKVISTKFNNFPFGLRGMDKDVKFGLNEIKQHGLIEPYPVLCEKKNEFTVHFKTTFLIMKNETVRSTGMNVQEFKSEKKLDSKFVSDVNDAKKNKSEDKMEIVKE
jgi:curved DNA binding protein